MNELLFYVIIAMLLIYVIGLIIADFIMWSIKDYKEKQEKLAHEWDEEPITDRLY